MEYDEIMERLKNAVSTDVHPLSEEALEREKKRFLETHKKSLELFEDAKNVIPGGVEHNLATSHPFPLAMDRAKGYRMWDIDGNEYLDYLLCGAPIILGHHFDPLDDEVIKIIKEKGPSTGLTSEYEVLAAKEIIKHVPSVESVRFLQTGTEAAMAAIRIARAYTDKAKVIKVSGSYHGWSDQVVYSLHLPGTGPLESKGIPVEFFQHLIDVMPNDLDALEKAFEDSKDQGGVAAVILEPVGGESGVHPVHPDWNRRCRELCDAYESLLIFDEVVTGFRLDMGGAQKYFNVMPDLTTFGKIIAHGYPAAGAVAGRKEIMDICAAGLAREPYLGGTLAANPISCGACYHALRLIEEHDAVKKATEYANQLTDALNNLFATREDLPFFVYNYGPIMHYVTTAFFSVDLKGPDPLTQIMTRKDLAEEYQMVATNQGLNSLAGTRMYSCMQHDKAALDRTLEIWEYIMSLIPKG
jgi:glutamate-1-semialdehyde 2,1-aminomutase